MSVSVSTPSAMWRICLVLICVTALIGWKLDLNTVGSFSTTGDVQYGSQSLRCNNSTTASSSNIIYPSTSDTSLHPGELPGYTGWARPQQTLAKFFSIVELSTDTPTVGQPWIVTVQCRGHEDCDKDASLFFLRAYGPAVLPGKVVNIDKKKTDNQSIHGLYELQFVFHDPGQYTVEAILTFSAPPPINSFPVSDASQQPAYEGYLLPEFPLTVTVLDAGDERQHSTRDNNLCTMDDMTISSTHDAISKVRWVVQGKNNMQSYSNSTIQNSDNSISKRGYIRGVNALGIQMEYQHLSNCQLLPESAFDRNLHDQRVFAQCPKLKNNNHNNNKIHIIYIGDSVLRVQKDKLRALANRMDKFLEFHYLKLHLGYRRNQVLGPSNVTAFLNEIQDKYPDDPKVIMFNTGLHDIHQLCGAENAEDRRTYMDTALLDSGTFSCTAEYREIMQDFVAQIQQFPAQLRVFQTSTAAWPKYGNWGIAWEDNPQNMPLVSDFVHAFNGIAVDVVDENNAKNNSIDKIHMMDGYWMTYARPDNREIGDIGKKLSHPGDEVLSVMARMWSKMILDAVC